MSDSNKKVNLNPNVIFRESVTGVQRLIPEPQTSGVDKVHGSIDGLGGLKPYMPAPAKKDTSKERK